MSTQTTEALTRQVIKLVSAQIGIPAEQISVDSHFTTDLAFDSLDKVDFVMTVEEQFNIVVPEEVSDTINTVGDAVQAIQKLTTN